MRATLHIQYSQYAKEYSMIESKTVDSQVRYIIKGLLKNIKITLIKVRLSPSKKICFNLLQWKSSFKNDEKCFYFI